MVPKKNNPKVATTKKPAAKSTSIPKKTTAPSTKSKETAKQVAQKKTSSETAKSVSSASILNLEDVHIISKTKGSAMISTFLDVTDANPMPFTINKAFEFNKEIFDLIFSDVNVIGIRIYFAVNDLNELCLVFTGTDAAKNDTYIPLNATMQSTLNDFYGVADMGQVCPPVYGKGIIQLP